MSLTLRLDVTYALITEGLTWEQRIEFDHHIASTDTLESDTAESARRRLFASSHGE